jgi:hypothetical protein
MRTLLYVDDLLIAFSSFEETSQTHRIIEETLLVAGIVRAPLNGCFDTPLETLPDHLGFKISTIGTGAVDSDLLRRFAGAVISCLTVVPLARFHLREVFNSQE